MDTRLAMLLCDALPPQGAWRDGEYLWLTDRTARLIEFRYGEAPAFNAWAAVPGSGADTVEHTVPELANGTRYVFEVRAVDDDRAGEASRLGSKHSKCKGECNVLERR